MSVLVTQPAPDFTAPAVMPNGTIRDDSDSPSCAAATLFCFFWPLDFTFVCPTESCARPPHRPVSEAQRGSGRRFHRFAVHSFCMAQLAVLDGGIGPVQFPMVADISTTSRGPTASSIRMEWRCAPPS